MSPLKPCPFCGDEAGPEIDGDERATIGAGITIYCNGCHASAATEYSFAAAAKRWNTRTDTNSDLLGALKLAIRVRLGSEVKLTFGDGEQADRAMQALTALIEEQGL